MKMQEAAVREAIADGDYEVKHIPGAKNNSDLLTKEHKDQLHFCNLRDIMVPPLPGMGGVEGSEEVAEQSPHQSQISEPTTSSEEKREETER